MSIYPPLAEANPQAYLRDVAKTLNNLAALDAPRRNFQLPRPGTLRGAGDIPQRGRGLPETHLPNVANTLNNLAFLQQAKNEFAAAEAGYQEALVIYRNLTRRSGHGNHAEQPGEFGNRTRMIFPWPRPDQEGRLAIRRSLAEGDLQIYLLDVVMTAVNISVFYLQAMPDREKSLAYAKEKLIVALPYFYSVPVVRNYAKCGAASC